MRARRCVLEATPVVIISDAVGGIHVSRGTWRKARKRVLHLHTLAALWSCVSFSAVIMFELFGEQSWAISWSAVVGFLELVYAMHGWRFADEKTVNFIVSAVLHNSRQHNATP